jgi:hypothetical protein
MRVEKQMSLVALVAAAITSQAGLAQAQTSEVVASWIQLAPGSSPAALANGSYGDMPHSLTNTILARAVVTNAASCPAITVAGGPAISLTMKQRFIGSQLTNTPGTSGATNGKTGYPQYFVSASATAPANFANGTAMATTSWGECEAVIPAGYTSATIGGTTLKLPVAQPKKILLIADTGCRVNGALSATGGNQQNCSNPVDFPLAFLSGVEASKKPDLIVHIGDWFYRDTNCLTSGVETFTGCNTTTSPNYEVWGDIFDSWNADVFYPMKPLLAAAPIVMVRGNHESCGRGARGWFALLDAYPFNMSNVLCAKTGTYPAPSNNLATYTGDFEPSYLVGAGGFNVIVHDSSFANDSAVDKNTAANYDVDLTGLLGALAPNSVNIFATHKPTFGLVYGSDGAAGSAPATADNSGDFTEQSVFSGGTYAASAFLGGVPSNIALFISGHIHQAQFVSFLDNVHFAPQLVVGVSGSLLDPDMNTGFTPVGTTEVPTYTEPTAPVNPTADNFNQAAAHFTVNTYNGNPFTTLARKAASHDEFGYAILTVQSDGNGNVTGFDADVYKYSMNKYGSCHINVSPRTINCNF